MQFEWWRKREEKREPAIRLVRDSSSGEGGGGRSVVTFLFWNGAQWRRRWFIPWVSASIFGRICAHSFHFPNRRKVSELEWNFETLEFFFFFVSSFIVFTFRLYFSSTLCTLRRSIDHPSRYLFFFFVFPSAVSFSICLFIRYSSFHYCFLSFFSFRFANPFFVAIFYKILHCISHGIFFDQKKEKHGWKEDLFDDIWRGNFSVDADKPAMNSNQGPRLGPHSTSRIPILKLVTPPRSAPMRSFSPLILSAFLIFDSIFFSERKGRKI